MSYLFPYVNSNYWAPTDWRTSMQWSHVRHRRSAFGMKRKKENIMEARSQSTSQFFLDIMANSIREQLLVHASQVQTTKLVLVSPVKTTTNIHSQEILQHQYWILYSIRMYDTRYDHVIHLITLTIVSSHNHLISLFSQLFITETTLLINKASNNLINLNNIQYTQWEFYHTV